MCTAIRFNDDKNNYFFGRNLDWTTDYGEKVTITPRNYKYSSAFLGEMSPKHGAIIGMAVIEENIPLYFDASNEGGLSISGLNFPGYAAYEPEPKSEKENVAAYEFPLYILMNFYTVEDVRKALENVAIVGKPINEKYPVAPLHFIIADKEQSIVVEYTKHGLEVHDNEPDVLTNQPDYNWHRENLRNYLNLFPIFPRRVNWAKTKMTAFGTGALMRGLPGGYSPSDRFVRAAYLNSHYPTKSSEKENVARLFHTLNSVAMIDGAAFGSDGKFEITLYTSCYSSATKTYYYNTYENLAPVAVQLENFNLDDENLIQA